MTILERFKAKVKIVEECWIWRGSISNQGYGKIVVNGKQERAHRVSYLLFKGPIKPLLVIDHKCRNKACVNPKHLRAITQKKNTLIGTSPPAINARKTHCIKGHELPKDRKCKSCLYAWRKNKYRATVKRRFNPRKTVFSELINY